ncbi:MAG: glycosyltransferase family 4 protein [Candidatus Methanoplasma sp.]|jgi:glycosyltransferase involved in cell wall biosynthesis|nr:glycosyltransferase family 4 protein [Candidatus Methanoplasma sp.]
MKIVDVNPFFYPFTGGIEHRMHDTSRLLAAKGHEVTVLTGRLPDTPEEEMTEFGYRIIRLRSKMLNIYNPPFISSENILETLNGIDADVANYNYRWAPSYNKDMKKYDGRKVFTYHNMWGEGIGIQARFSAMNDRRFSSCLDTFDHIIAVSDHVRNDLIGRGYPPKYVTSVPTGLSRYPEMGKGDGEFILSLGRLVKTKGLGFLVEAMRDVDFKLIICGRGPEQKHLERAVRRLGLEDRIEMRGWVEESEKERLMGSCRFFVMPSLFESFGLAATELMAHGRPIVYSDVNGLPGTVGDGGISVPPKDSAALSQAINMLINDRSYTEELGKNAAIRSQAYKWDGLIPKIESLYRKVLSGEYSAEDIRRAY